MRNISYSILLIHSSGNRWELKPTHRILKDAKKSAKYFTDAGFEVSITKEVVNSKRSSYVVYSTINTL